MEPVSLSAHDQRRENQWAGLSRPFVCRYLTSKPRHSSVVVFLSNLYQLPLPTPPTNSYLQLFAEIIRQMYLTWPFFTRVSCPCLDEGLQLSPYGGLRSSIHALMVPDGALHCKML